MKIIYGQDSINPDWYKSACFVARVTSNLETCIQHDSVNGDVDIVHDGIDYPVGNVGVFANIEAAETVVAVKRKGR